MKMYKVDSIYKKISIQLLDLLFLL